MDGNGTNTLTDKQLRVIPFLLEAPSIEEGCKRARVAKATVYGWLKERVTIEDFEKLEQIAREDRGKERDG